MKTDDQLFNGILSFSEDLEEYSAEELYDLSKWIKSQADKKKAQTVMCNMCGLSCNIHKDHHELYGLIEAEVSGGYYSTAGNGHGALDDGESYKFSICEYCLDWMFSHFAIKVKISEGGDDYIPAHLEAWRKGNKEFFKEFNKRKAARDAAIKKAEENNLSLEREFDMDEALG